VPVHSYRCVRKQVLLGHYRPVSLVLVLCPDVVLSTG
jgi:hypothetical protein